MRDTLRRPLRRWMLRGAAALLCVTALYFATLVRPQTFFSWRRDGASIRVRSDEPIPESAAHIISLAESRIRQSPLFDVTQTYSVYVCNDRWRWNYFSGMNRRSRAFQTVLGRAVFTRPAHWDENQLDGPDGGDGPRTLDMYIAHEVTHTMVADHMGIIVGRSLPVWLREGYAEYVARHGTFDYDATRARLLAGDEGLGVDDRYWKYLLLVTHLLDREKRDVGTVLNAPPDSDEVEARVRAGIAAR
ncbi:MAG: hypothetical protein ABL982_19070 [Vicinamibacterales bacterium]